MPVNPKAKPVRLPVARYLRVQFNAILVNSDQPDSDGWLAQGRLQFNW